MSWVLTGGPADQADVREGDIVLQFDNQKVSGAADLLGRIRRLGAGRLASMLIWRDGKEINTGLMTLAERGRYPGEIANPKPGGKDAPLPSSRGYDSRNDLRVAQLEGEIRDLDREITDLRRRIERLEATDRNMLGR